MVSACGLKIGALEGARKKVKTKKSSPSDGMSKSQNRFRHHFFCSGVKNTDVVEPQHGATH